MVEHNLGQQHVLECPQGRIVLHTAVLLERLVEVGERRLEVLLLGGVQDTGLQVQLRLPDQSINQSINQ